MTDLNESNSYKYFIEIFHIPSLYWCFFFFLHLLTLSPDKLRGNDSISAELIFPQFIHSLWGSHELQKGSQETGFEGLSYKLYSLVKQAVFHFKDKIIN